MYNRPCGNQWKWAKTLNMLRILTILTVTIALTAVVVIINSVSSDVLASEVAVLPVVLGLTLLLGVLSYEPGRLFGQFKRLFKQNRSSQPPLDKRMIAQLALYALASGLVLSIIQVLPTAGKVGQSEHIKTAMWSLLYGVLTAIVLWVVSGLDKPEEQDDQGKTVPSDKNQIILAFCVLLLMVGALSLLFIEMFIASDSKAPALQRKTAQQTSIGYGDMRLGEDMIYRPVSFMDRSGQKNIPIAIDTLVPVPVQAIPNRASSQNEHAPTEALLRWELSLDQRVEGHSIPHQEDLALPAVYQSQ